MTIGEFKAWLAGYLESCSASPAKRVKRIEEQLAIVRENPVGVYQVYRDMYVYPRTQPHWQWTPTITTGTNTADWKFTTNKIVCNDVTGDTTTTVAYLNAGGE